MPSLDALLTWAIPVRVELLGAHLTAYLELLPTLCALRLCHRYGRGYEVNLTRLPIELLSAIEDLLFAEACVPHVEAYKKDFRCFQHHCNPIDHMTEEQMVEWDGKAAEHGVPNVKSWRNPDHMELADGTFGLDLRFLRVIHDERTASWETTRSGRVQPNKCIFQTHEADFTRIFGLDTWVADVRLHSHLKGSIAAQRDFEAPESTIAYLCLPESRQESISWQVQRSEQERYFVIDSTYGMPVKMPQPLSGSIRARFAGAMATLRLQPFVHATQKGLALSVEGRTEGDEVSESSSWPQLMLLAQCMASTDGSCYDPPSS